MLVALQQRLQALSHRFDAASGRGPRVPRRLGQLARKEQMGGNGRRGGPVEGAFELLLIEGR